MEKLTWNSCFFLPPWISRANWLVQFIFCWFDTWMRTLWEKRVCIVWHSENMNRTLLIYKLAHPTAVALPWQMLCAFHTCSQNRHCSGARRCRRARESVCACVRCDRKGDIGVRVIRVRIICTSSIPRLPVNFSFIPPSCFSVAHSMISEQSQCVLNYLCALEAYTRDTEVSRSLFTCFILD